MTLPRVGNQYRCTLRMFLFQQMRDIALVLGLDSGFQVKARLAEFRKTGTLSPSES
jgi:hypothetical protein